MGPRQSQIRQASRIGQRLHPVSVFFAKSILGLTGKTSGFRSNANPSKPEQRHEDHAKKGEKSDPVVWTSPTRSAVPLFLELHHNSFFSFMGFFTNFTHDLTSRRSTQP